MILATAEQTDRLKLQALDKLRAGLRPGQQEMVDWHGGRLAVSAVPGAGKSTGMAAGVASAIARFNLNQRRQLLVVTFTRSAVTNLKSKIREKLRDLGLPQGGFTVQTLHSLALSIANRYPERSGLERDSFTLIRPNQNHRLVRTAVERWIAASPHQFRQLIETEPFDGEETERLRRQTALRTEALPNLANTVIHEAKSSGLLPDKLRELAITIQAQIGDGAEILAIAAGLYEHYQQLLAQRHLIDYDDMMLSAMRVLDDLDIRRVLQTQIFAVFEDEAQDSTPLQTHLLEILASDPEHPNAEPNLVRVGDPNQAINSTFTPADPIFFRHFCQTCETHDRLATIDRAGRSSTVILNAANFTLGWVNQACRPQPIVDAAHLITNDTRSSVDAGDDELPFRFQQIRPVGSDDPQPNANPAPEGLGLELYEPADVFETLELMARRVVAFFEQHPQQSAAILVRNNQQGQFLARRLRNPQTYGLKTDLTAQGIRILEVGERDRQSQIPAEMLALLQWLDRPHSPQYLKAVLTVLSDRRLIPPQDYNAIVAEPERFLYPGPLEPPIAEGFRPASAFCRALLKARQELPPYQLLLFLGMALQYEAAELATAEKLAERIVQQAAGYGSLLLTLDALAEIVSSERFDPIDPEESDNQYTQARQLTIITMHKAKGLDWDVVFIPFLHKHHIPGNRWVPASTRFLGEFSLSEVARAQIRAYLHQTYANEDAAWSVADIPDLETAWKRAERLKTAEEYRLLYVAMTRAKRLLWISAEARTFFNFANPQVLDDKSVPCPVFLALKQHFPQSLVSTAPLKPS
jgi:DNA helicase II / ATP-dependent DNA helicase PcrA